MAKVTSKRQVTIPKRIADRYGIGAGDELSFAPLGDAIRVAKAEPQGGRESPGERLRRFDEATARQADRDSARPRRSGAHRDWRREDLYGRGRAG